MSSKKSKVYFGSFQNGRNSVFASFAVKLDKIVELLLEETPIEKKDKVAVKMHLGFNDGYQTIPVFFVRRIVEAIKKAGGYPFVTDNPTSVYNAVNRVIPPKLVVVPSSLLLELKMVILNLLRLTTGG